MPIPNVCTDIAIHRDTRGRGYDVSAWCGVTRRILTSATPDEVLKLVAQCLFQEDPRGALQKAAMECDPAITEAR